MKDEETYKAALGCVVIYYQISTQATWNVNQKQNTHDRLEWDHRRHP